MLHTTRAAIHATGADRVGGLGLCTLWSFSADSLPMSKLKAWLVVVGADFRRSA